MSDATTFMELPEMAAGSVFHIRAPNLAAAGYLSSPVYNAHAFELMEQGPEPQKIRAGAPNAPVGGQGETRYLFRALMAGEFEIQIQARRPWAPLEAGSSLVFRLRVSPCPDPSAAPAGPLPRP